ncbi:Fungal Zn(2)-Cys(6) binuclear cluster domain-containing protein [Penicillium ucsense]|uniref:Fungal Zn(2)-Cys(6) binuclear cluster domain-containing protein n=1 Tax=Penicillium ucsense TaxID=2839758 RepID=A0A8J8W0A0_9EURO|nr:Fungal Zn(2)-Cys(6) binuclear cluster domain-containing protein [Penicillium ucsense]KAF7730890.1 Fungal Zn(2)-Cys(6) binuclear cluster domain-containing protein [Penicillium ucsense]
MARRNPSRRTDQLDATDEPVKEASQLVLPRQMDTTSSSSSPYSAIENSLPTPGSEESPSAESGSSRSRRVSITHPGAPNAKIAIPRDVGNIGALTTGRVSRACSSCRARKVKCSGEQPVCRQCRDLHLHCHYPLGWNERMKKETHDLTALLQEYRSLVKDLVGSDSQPRGPCTQALIHNYPLLKDDLGDSIPPLEAPQDSTSLRPSTPSVGQTSQSHLPADILSRFANMAYEVPGVSGQGGSAERPLVTDDIQMNTAEQPVNTLSWDIPQPIDKHGLPTRELADHLFEQYWCNVHPFFPMINRPLFRVQYQNFWDQGQQPGDKWLAILNVIFAIAAKYTHMIQAPSRGSENDHVVYFNRARLLSLNGEELFSPPNLQQVQLEGLVAFYLLATDQIGRAWRISALAARSAITLSVNRSHSKKLPARLREARFRLWWCLHTLEQTLSLISGHITSIPKDRHAPPLPIPFEEEDFETNSSASALLQHPSVRIQWLQTLMPSSRSWPSDGDGRPAQEESRPRDEAWLKRLEPNAGLFYLFYCDLAVIIEEIINQLHVSNIWIDKERRLDDLQSRLEYWRNSLPSSLDITSIDPQCPVEQIRYKLGLALHYQSARIVLGRLWFCRRDELGPDNSLVLNQSMATMTLDAAKQILDLIPDQLDTTQLYKTFPWWSVLYYISQAARIILFELSTGCVHMQDSTTHLILLSQKALRWLHAMSTRSPGAERAWHSCDTFYRKVSEQRGYNTDSIPLRDVKAESMSFVGPQDNGSMSDLEKFDFQIDEFELTDWIP